MPAILAIVGNLSAVSSDVMATPEFQVTVTVAFFSPSSPEPTLFPSHALRSHTCIELCSLFSQFVVELKAIEQIDLACVLCM
jgi:hypothetical protein